MWFIRIIQNTPVGNALYMNKISLVPFVVLLLLITPHTSAKQALPLHGSSIHFENNVSFYIAGLYLGEPTSDLNAILSPQMRKKMQIVISKPKWRSRGWRQHWRNSIAINNPGSTGDKEALKGLIGFTSMVKGDLLKGDEIIVDYEDNLTQVYLNGELVLKSKGSTFVKFLLRTWLGEVPPSSQFRKDLLTAHSGVGWEANSGLLSGYRFPVNRSGIYSGWLAGERAIVDAEKKRIAKIRADALAQQKKAAQRKAELALAAKKREEARKRDARRKAALAKQANAKKVVVPSTPPPKSKEEIAFERREAQEYYLRLIEWQIQRYVDNNIEYPHWALKFAEEGLVELEFQINRQGEVVSLDDNSNQDSMLVKELLRVVKNAGPIITIPASIEKDSWVLRAIHLFSLKGETLPSALAPDAPIFLEAERLSASESEKILNEYREKVTTLIKKDIVYPEWARISRKRGTVTLNITLNRLGEIESVDMVKKTHSDDLNQIVLDAVNNNAPFKIIPLEVDADIIVVQLQHRFK